MPGSTADATAGTTTAAVGAARCTWLLLLQQVEVQHHLCLGCHLPSLLRLACASALSSLLRLLCLLRARSVGVVDQSSKVAGPHHARVASQRERDRLAL